MATDKSMVDRHVYAWYASPARWCAQGKQKEWADRVLCDHGVLFYGKDVLNLGCFYPEDEDAFAHLAHTWTAIDFVHEVIERCRAHRQWPSHVRFEVADMRELPYADQSFDVVTDFSSGDHLLREDWIKTIREAARVLRPQGRFLVCFANREAFIKLLGPQGWAVDTDQFGDYGYTRTDTFEGMVTMLEENGFKVIRRSHDNDLQLRAGMLAQKL
jgi:SAM-dependent methyltransferase